MSCRSTTTPRNQFSAATPSASANSTSATTHATGLRTTDPPPTFEHDCGYPEYLRADANATNG
ncbi:hypothetical protein GCM10019016_026650 [Streptomyces prasinosporus]|uniref:Uncharacterized protein n=1 Tax=Streptomyces prasinosporus TaxID=68256 RepID=A0ABP6TK35_9ACTN